jgi:CcmD family protein
MENLGWLFFAYGLAFLVIFAYLFQIARTETKLRRRIGELQEMMEERWKK